jgi:hypothetical protein
MAKIKASNDVIEALQRNKELQSIKDPWLDHLQIIGEFIHMRRQDFTQSQDAGAFLNREIFDSAGPRAAKIATSSILSMLWPNTSKRFRFKPPRELRQTRAIKEYYEGISEIVLGVMDNPKACLQLALDEYMLEQICFGTSGVEPMRDQKTKVKYKAWGVKSIKIAEGRDGMVDTVYIELELPVHRVVKEYGEKNVSGKVRDLFNNRQFDKKVKVLIAVEPRITIEAGARGNKAMPWRSLHIDMQQKHIMREKGFTEMPIKIARFWKIVGEQYGRSPGMDALPDIIEANTIWEGVTIAIEKSLDPPLGVLDDGKLGGGTIDTSAGAINVFNITGRAGEKNPIFPLFTIGEIKQTVKLLEELGNKIADHFFIDRLLDFNNETKMTLGEANIRNRLRNMTLGSIFSRQITEVFSPLIERTFNILLANDELGVVQGSVEELIQREIERKEPLIIPPEVVELMTQGKDVYEIEYFTPAMRIMQAEELEGIIRTWEFINMNAQTAPTMADNVDSDISVRRFAETAGAPSETLRAPVDVEEIRNGREEAARLVQEQQQIMAGAEAARNLGQSGLVPTAQNA